MALDCFVSFLLLGGKGSPDELVVLLLPTGAQNNPFIGLLGAVLYPVFGLGRAVGFCDVWREKPGH